MSARRPERYQVTRAIHAHHHGQASTVRLAKISDTLESDIGRLDV
jgi:hypothetical protein